MVHIGATSSPSAAMNSSFGSFTLRSCSLRMSEQHADGSKPHEKLCCRTSNNKKIKRKPGRQSSRKKQFHSEMTYTSYSVHEQSNIAMEVKQCGTNPKFSSSLQIFKYRSDLQFKDVSTLGFRDKSSSEAMPMGRGACDSRATHHCWQQFLGCCSLGEWRCQGMFLTEATPAVPHLPIPGHANPIV